MGNVVESVEIKFEEATRYRNQAEDQEYDYVIDMDSENWKEKVQEYKKLWYARHSSNSKESKDNTKSESYTKELNTDKSSIVNVKQQEMKNSEEQQESGFQCVGCHEKDQNVQTDQEQERHELTESFVRSQERIKFFRRKYKLSNPRDCTARNNNYDLTDVTTEKEERERSKQLRRRIRNKYQLPVKGCHSGTVNTVAYN